MHRFFLPPSQLNQDLVVLTGEVHHHLHTVLRLKPPAEILLLDGLGQVCLCRLEKTDRKSSRARVTKRWREEEAVLPITLLQGLPKGDKMTLILQKGTELGITGFQPVLTRHCVSRVAAGRKDQVVRRWETVVREASRQCGRPMLPKVFPILDLTEALDACREEFRILLWEEAGRPLSEVLPDKAPADVAILAGPEGGLPTEEAALAERHRFIPVRLGPRILRTETAGWAAAAILQHCFGDLSRGTGRKFPPPEE